MKKILLFGMLCLQISCTHSLEKKIPVEINIETQKDIESTNFIDYIPINIIDGNNLTSWGYLRKGTDRLVKTRAVISFNFSQSISIDRICVKNGQEREFEAFNRAKNIRLYIGNNLTKDKFIQKDIVLKDSIYKKYYKFAELSNVNEINIQFRTVYPGYTYDITCVSEIEFWYKGQKYEFSNLEEAKKKFIEKRKQNTIRWVKFHSEDINDQFYYVFENPSDIIGKLREMGVKIPQDINIDKSVFMYTIVKHQMHGKMIMYTRERDLYEIGSWRIDENGSLWLKVGNSQEFFHKAQVIESGPSKSLSADWLHTIGWRIKYSVPLSGY